MSFLARLISDNSRTLEKIELRDTVLPATLRKKFCTSSINFRDINGVPKLGPTTLIRGHHKGSKVVLLDSTGMIACQRGCILHCFRDIAFDKSKIAIFGYSSCVRPLTEGFSFVDLRKILPIVQRMAKVQNGIETCLSLIHI